MNYETSLAFPVTSCLSAQHSTTNNISQVFTVEEVRPLSSLCQVMESMGSVAQVMTPNMGNFLLEFSHTYQALFFEKLFVIQHLAQGFTALVTLLKPLLAVLVPI